MSQKEKQPQTDSGVRQKVFAGLLRSWFELTADEQKAVITVLAIFLLGLAVRTWHIQMEESKGKTGHITTIHQTGEEITKNLESLPKHSNY